MSVPAFLPSAFRAGVGMDDVIEDRGAVHAGKVPGDAFSPDRGALVVGHDYDVVYMASLASLAEITQQGHYTRSDELGESVEK